MIVGCYDFRLDCDGKGCSAGEFGVRMSQSWTAELGSKCRKAARRAGWKMFRNGLCLCPTCVRIGAEAAP